MNSEKLLKKTIYLLKKFPGKKFTYLAIALPERLPVSRGVLSRGPNFAAPEGLIWAPPARPGGP